MNIVEVILTVSMVIIAASIAITFIRVVRGPSLADRVISLDILTIIAAGMTAVIAMLAGSKTIVDISVLLALLSFLSTVAFAYYMEKERGND